ncbi:hypothetical protein [Paraburkholderia sartisoli]|nr:hypothetical protein [Paraburkholderia sartisoli]
MSRFYYPDVLALRADAAADHRQSANGRQRFLLGRYAGQPVGYMSPDANVEGTSGWIDMYPGLAAVQRANSEYVVQAEDDGRCARETPDVSLNALIQRRSDAQAPPDGRPRAIGI